MITIQQLPVGVVYQVEGASPWGVPCLVGASLASQTLVLVESQLHKKQRRGIEKDTVKEDKVGQVMTQQRFWHAHPPTYQD